ncbi:MAG TPA: cytochrome c oxidase accessory protein CcoG [Crocinitomix sp.]|nr:cytochrome c oxidase accessory protein CcoG [Crocinitomix sp.]
MSRFDEEFRDSISTVDKDGKRKWVFVKKVSGRWFNRRQWFAYSLLVLLFVGPFLKINGEPILMLNIVKRKFVILGQIFWPEDSYLFAIGMLAFVVLIIVFTVVFGRLFCGWACPQTIFLEMVFRRIEFWIDGDWNQQKKLDKLPWKGLKLRKRLFKWFIFWSISFLITNTFLAYIISIDEVLSIITAPPSEHIGGFIAIVIFTSVFFAVFTWFREQVCIAVCPYGRLQGVLLDENSVLVAYDYKRGESRGKFRKNEDRKEIGKGDCIDCGQCVNVCPTGIDIRNGTQLECVNCTACMDACDFMMEKVGLEKGLIRYDSEKGIKNGVDFTLSGRAKAYIVLMFIILGLLVGLLFSRSDVEATILRVPNTTYQKIDKETISNIYNVTLINKTSETLPVEMKIIEGNAELESIGEKIINLEVGKQLHREVLVKMKRKDLKGTKTPITIGVFANGTLVEKATVNFSGPGF